MNLKLQNSLTRNLQVKDQVSVDNELHSFFGFSVKDSVKFDALIDFIIVYLRYLVSPCWLEYLKQSFIDLVLFGLVRNASTMAGTKQITSWPHCKLNWWCGTQATSSASGERANQQVASVGPAGWLIRSCLAWFWFAWDWAQQVGGLQFVSFEDSVSFTFLLH